MQFLIFKLNSYLSITNIYVIFQNVRSLKELYLGHNAMGYEGGCLLAKCLGKALYQC